MAVRQKTPWEPLTAVEEEPNPMEIPEIPLEGAPNNSNNNNDNNDVVDNNEVGKIFDRLGKLETSHMNKELSRVFTQCQNFPIGNNKVPNLGAEEKKEVKEAKKAKKVLKDWDFSKLVLFFMTYLPTLFEKNKDIPNYQGSVGKILEDAKSELDNNHNPGQERERENEQRANARRSKSLYVRKKEFLAFFYKLSEKMRKAVDEFATRNKNEHDELLMVIECDKCRAEMSTEVKNEYKNRLEALKQETCELFPIDLIVQRLHKKLFKILPGELGRNIARIKSKTRKAYLNNLRSVKFRWKQNVEKNEYIAAIVLYLHSYRHEFDKKILRCGFRETLKNIENNCFEPLYGWNMNNVGPYYGQEYFPPQDGIQAWQPP